MQLLREIRLIKPLTFPVTTMALVHNGKEYLDPEYKELCAEEWAKGGSFFCYTSDNPTSLASCCFSKDTKILWKSSTEGVKLTTLEELHNTKWDPYKKNLKIFHNGSWVGGKSIKLPNRQMYKVTTYNNKEYYMTDNHINVTLEGEKPTSELSLNDYLLFNTKPLAAIPENNEHLTFSQGFVIGAFLGDGSFGPEIKGTIYETILIVTKENYQTSLENVFACGNIITYPGKVKKAISGLFYSIISYIFVAASFLQDSQSSKTLADTELLPNSIWMMSPTLTSVPAFAGFPFMEIRP